MRVTCFYCGQEIQPGEPRLRMIWGVCTNLTHVPCAGASVHHLLINTGEREVVLVGAA
jgi:hypothetical protein